MPQDLADGMGEESSLVSVFYHFIFTRSYAALRAADLDWIVGPGYRAGINKNVTYPGSQLTFLDGGGGAGQE